MNGDSKCTNERGPWACRAGTRDFCSAFAALVGPAQYKMFFPHYFNSFFLIAQQAGQAAVLGRLSLSVCLWYRVQSTKSDTRDYHSARVISLLNKFGIFCLFYSKVSLLSCVHVSYMAQYIFYFLECSMRSHTIFLISVLGEFIRPTLC